MNRPITLAVEAYMNLVFRRVSHLIVSADPEAEEYIAKCGGVFTARGHTDEPLFPLCPDCRD